MSANLKNAMTMKEAMAITPKELLAYLNKLCDIEIPTTIETVDDMRMASTVLSKCAAVYSYLLNMEMTAKVMKRVYKRSGESKELVEDALIREEIFGNYAEIVKTYYNAVSRLVTIKQQVNSELRMLGDNLG